MAKKAIFKVATVAMSNFKNDRNRIQYLMLCTKFH